MRGLPLRRPACLRHSAARGLAMPFSNRPRPGRQRRQPDAIRRTPSRRTTSRPKRHVPATEPKSPAKIASDRRAAAMNRGWPVDTGNRYDARGVVSPSSCPMIRARGDAAMRPWINNGPACLAAGIVIGLVVGLNIAGLVAEHAAARHRDARPRQVRDRHRPGRRQRRGALLPRFPDRRHAGGRDQSEDRQVQLVLSRATSRPISAGPAETPAT